MPFLLRRHDCPWPAGRSPRPAGKPPGSRFCGASLRCAACCAAPGTRGA